MEILRREYKYVKSIDSWTLIYGRRKVGKSFLVRKYFPYDFYVIITRDLKAYEPNSEEFLKLDDAIKQSVDYLKKGKRVVIDEFQRLPETYWDPFTTVNNGTLLLVGSSFRISKKVFESRSPLLGFVLPYKLDLIHYSDVLNSVKDPLLSTIYKDPWTVQFVKNVDDLYDKAYQLYMITKGLIGEIFEEEERQLTMLYEAIMLSLAEGEWNTSLISGKLASRGFNVPPSTVSGYLDTLANMGLVDKIPIYGEKGRARWYYRLSSPIISLMFYAEAKYNVSFTEEVKELPIGREVQFCIGELMAEKYEGTLAYSPYEDIDIVILKGKNPIIGYEVKIGEIDKSEAERAVERIRKAGIPKTGLISLKDKPRYNADEVYGPDELKEVSKEIAKRVGL